MIDLKESACCGCGTCAIVCPTKSIRMVENDAGFIYPKINGDLCVNCGKCNKVCPVLNFDKKEDRNHKVFAAYSKDEGTRFDGSSGGIFGTIAQNFIKVHESATVYGAKFDENLNLMLDGVSDIENLKPLYKSKYIQSDVGEKFVEIKDKLDRKEYVLFVSTPCQVYALKRYLNKDYDNLFTVDFVCHGVPSQSLFNKCKEYVEKRKKIKILSYQFRAKIKRGATPHYFKMVYEKNGKIRTVTKLYTKSPFYLGFQKYITLRDSCYNCQFCLSHRCSDITIGDFHDVDKYIKGINRFDGISLVTINTRNGEKLFEEIKQNLQIQSLDFEVLLKDKQLMAGGTEEPNNRKQFIKDLKEKDFNYIVLKYFNSKKEWKKVLYYRLPKFIRLFIKKIKGV